MSPLAIGLIIFGIFLFIVLVTLVILPLTCVYDLYGNCEEKPVALPGGGGSGGSGSGSSGSGSSGSGGSGSSGSSGSNGIKDPTNTSKVNDIDFWAQINRNNDGTTMVTGSGYPELVALPDRYTEFLSQNETAYMHDSWQYIMALCYKLLYQSSDINERNFVAYLYADYVDGLFDKDEILSRMCVLLYEKFKYYGYTPSSNKPLDLLRTYLTKYLKYPGEAFAVDANAPLKNKDLQGITQDTNYIKKLDWGVAQIKDFYSTSIRYLDPNDWSVHSTEPIYKVADSTDTIKYKATMGKTYFIRQITDIENGTRDTLEFYYKNDVPGKVLPFYSSIIEDIRYHPKYPEYRQSWAKVWFRGPNESTNDWLWRIFVASYGGSSAEIPSEFGYKYETYYKRRDGMPASAKDALNAKKNIDEEMIKLLEDYALLDCSIMAGMAKCTRTTTGLIIEAINVPASVDPSKDSTGGTILTIESP